MNDKYDLTKRKVSASKAFKFIIGLFRPYIKKVTVVLLFSLTATTASILIPQTLQIAIDEILPVKDIEALNRLALLFIFLMAVFFSATVTQTLLQGRISQNVLFALRRSLFAKIQELPLAFFNKNKLGDIELRISANVENINRFFSEGAVRLINITASMTGFLIMMWNLSSSLTMIVLFSTLIFLSFLYFQGGFLRRYQKQSLDIEGDLSSKTQEILEGYPTIKIYGRNEAFKNIYGETNNSLVKQNIKLTSLASIGDGLLPFLQITSGTLILYFGFFEYQTGTITAGILITFLSYLVIYYRRFEGIGNLWTTIQSGIAAAQRILELFELSSDINPQDPVYDPPEVKGDVEFKNIHFSYEKNKIVLKDIDLKIEAGQKIAIVGPTGGGKTSFVSLLTRLYDPNQGKILIDGIDIRHWELNALRKNVGYLIQETFFFEDTIFNNMKYVKPNLTRGELIETIQSLGINDFIDALPNGIEAMISATTISAGQKQILALLRLALRDPRILILDEATANIDTRTEKTILKAINNLSENRTSFIIAHRLSTIFNADQILLIQNNTILERGSHQELLKQKGKYYNIYSRFTKS